MVSLTDRSLDGLGTDESVWSACTELRGLTPCSVPPPDSGRVVVVAPHPDDEVLGAGGALASLAARGTRVLLVAVTEGEASTPERARGIAKSSSARISSRRRGARYDSFCHRFTQTPRR